MIQVKQTIFGDKIGNCFQACVASILELSLNDVPHFCHNDNPNWSDDINNFLSRYDLYFIEVIAPCSAEIIGYHTISGKSPRKIPHAVVGKDKKMVFDPHPDNTGLETETGYGLFVKRMMNSKIHWK